MYALITSPNDWKVITVTLVCVICVGISIYTGNFGISLASIVFSVSCACLAMPKSYLNSRPVHGTVLDAIVSIDGYTSGFKAIINRKKRLFFNLTREQQQAAIPTYRRYKEVEYLATEENAQFLQKLTQFSGDKYGISSTEFALRRVSLRPTNPYVGISTLNAFVRDWSSDSTCREALYEVFWKHLPPRCKLLVPGAGLGRLASDAVSRGFDVTAIEIDPAMTISAQYALSKPAESKIFPFVHEFSYWYEGRDQLEGVTLDFSSAKPVRWLQRNFLDVTETFDCLATLFFIDTAQNIFDYLKAIKRVVKPGGVWVNYGPLKWGSAPFCEPSANELINFLTEDGWKIDAVWKGANRYDGSPHSMLASQYLLIGWRATRIATT